MDHVHMNLIVLVNVVDLHLLMTVVFVMEIILIKIVKVFVLVMPNLTVLVSVMEMR